MAPITEQEQAEARQEFLRDAADMGTQRIASYGTYRDWSAGDHKVPLSDRQRRYLQRSGIPWCENFCATVADVVIDRVSVESFTADAHDAKGDTGEEGRESEAADQANDWWQQDNMDETQAIVHEELVILGDGFVVVDWLESEKRPRWTYNRPEMVKPVYNPEQPDELLYVSKVWPSLLDGQPIRRLNLYYPDRIEKWYTLSNGDGNDLWHAFLDETDYEQQANEHGDPVPVAVWPLPWVDKHGEPLGIPVFHFRWHPGVDQMGRSEIRGVVPQNEGLNKQILDLFDLVDYLGTPTPYATGMEGDIDRTFVIGEWFTIPAENAKVGVIPGADPTGILAAIQAQIQRLAARSKTPLHMLLDGGSPPSGETLKAAEAPLVKKVEKRRTSIGNTWARAMQMGFKLADTFGDVTLPDGVTFDVQWEDAETRNEQAEATTAQTLHDVGVSRYTLLSGMGYDPDEEAERRKDEADEAMEAFGTAFDKGMTPGAQLPADGRNPTTPSNAAPTKPAVSPATATVRSGAS